ncbi:GntR family transcriptional regulator [Paucibacter sp. PLA-PC-4]|uniref:GntR family transcriptional regulator n=1 Tax=Paucibacter sp. PLA-PC-4 TaxID=2993655 RepID=UPI00224A5CA1|nr:GntR family transcriptional regulator [Paucibacter sp. PLA-PC-4]MCX2865668.1 GntR family transcriptional regulator [Paucibacter sp. PLA-PC-4]
MPAHIAAPIEQPPGLSRYGALAAALRSRIVAGEWPPGSALPAEQTLAGQHGVALGTMRQALALLVEQGLIERIHGRGTFVRAGLSGAPMLRFFRFGDGTETPKSRIVSRQTLAAPAGLAHILGLPSGEAVLRLRRVRLLDGLPRLAEEIWLPLPLCAALQHSDTASWGDLLYPHLAAACGVHVHRAVDQISFGQLGAADAKALQLPTAHPCAIVQRQAFDISGRCIEWRSSRGDAHAFHYTVSIS